MRADGVEEDTGRDTMNLPGSKQAEENIEDFLQLLPGIPNHISITQIAARLPWRALHIVSSVSRAWRQAIQGRQVYDARIRYNCSQTLVALNHRPSNDFRTIALYSIHDGSCYYLPPIPGVKGGIPRYCSCISLDGKLYILGGLKDAGSRSDDDTSDSHPASAEVYALDVAGQRKWKQCASMEDPRKLFGCGAKDGKIYVFGGCQEFEPVRGSEVYDPKANTWSPITPMPSLRFGHGVTAVGEELFVHDGAFYQPDFPERSLRNDMVDIDEEYGDYTLSSAFCVEIYHPNKNEWRIVEHFTSDRLEVVLAVGGKVHRVRLDNIQVYDMDAGSWNNLQPCLFVFDGPAPHDYVTGPIAIGPIAAVAVDDEVLAMLRWRYTPEESDGDEELDRDEELEEDDGSFWDTCLIKSQRFGAKGKAIVWQKLPCSLDLGEMTSYFMCAIQL